jgi:ATP-dependent helicase HrpA
VVSTVSRILTTAYEIEQRVKGSTSAALLPSLMDIKAQLGGLVFPGFVSATGRERLPDVVRYLRAIEKRLDVLPNAAARDRERLSRVDQVQQEYRQLLAGLPPDGHRDETVRQIRWMIEELRVSLFAQTVGTPRPVSEKRIYRAMEELIA